MGTMDAGVFDNDAALDMLADVEKVPVDEIEAFAQATRAGIEDIDTIAACIAIHIALIHECHGVPPTVAFVEKVGAKVLGTFDAEADRLKPTAAFKAQRREILAKLLSDYRALAEPDE